MIRECNDFVNDLCDYKITINAFSKILVYEDNNEIIAFLDYSVMYDKIEINYIFVKEMYRNMGIASKLLQYVIDHNNFDNITLEVSVLNENAIKLYKKFNFKVIGKRVKYYNGIDAYLMERR